MNSIDDEIDLELQEIKDLDNKLKGKNNQYIKEILDEKSICFRRIMTDGNPDFINIVNGYIKVVKYSEFKIKFPNLYKYEKYEHGKDKKA